MIVARALLLLSVAAVPAAPPPTTDTASREIVVQGRNGPVVRSYVDRMARPEPGRQLARWNVPLCIRYDGLGEQYATYIKSRIEGTAHDLGVAIAARGCRANVLVKLADDADGLTRALVRRQPRRIGNLTNNSLLPKREAAALEAPHTVRWLTSSITSSRDGVPIWAGVSSLYTDSLIRSPVREDLDTKIILIDPARLANVTLRQLADYVAFVAFATPDIAADYSETDSIMALFSGDRSPPAAMTRQDHAFLDALYLIPADRDANTQKGAIRSRMKHVGR